MKKNNGFTLVELLAVIAILAILVIIALPNVMGMFNTAKKNSFTTEVKEVYKVAQQQWISDSMFETNEQIYSRCKTCSGKSLGLSGRTELDYFIRFNKAGDVTEYYATDKSYQFEYEGDGLAITDITDVDTVADLAEGEVFDITDDGKSINGVNLITFTLDKAEQMGYDVEPRTIKNYRATENMTWGEWVSSSYNKDHISSDYDSSACGDDVFKVYDTVITETYASGQTSTYISLRSNVSMNSVIIPNKTYYYRLEVCK